VSASRLLYTVCATRSLHLCFCVALGIVGCAQCCVPVWFGRFCSSVGVSAVVARCKVSIEVLLKAEVWEPVIPSWQQLGEQQRVFAGSGGCGCRAHLPMCAWRAQQQLCVCVCSCVCAWVHVRVRLQLRVCVGACARASAVAYVRGCMCAGACVCSCACVRGQDVQQLRMCVWRQQVSACCKWRVRMCAHAALGGRMRAELRGCAVASPILSEGREL
jgi:hypothetical protein